MENLEALSTNIAVQFWRDFGARADAASARDQVVTASDNANPDSLLSFFLLGSIALVAPGMPSSIGLVGRLFFR